MEKFLHLTFSTGQIFFLTAICLFVYVSIWGLFAIWKKRADLADIAWGLGFFLVAWISFLLSSPSLYSLIVTLLTTAWAFRLAIHIFIRNWNQEEDFRYQNIKKRWSKNFSLRIFFHVFLLQGAILYIVSLPILWINTHYASIHSHLFWLGIPLWLAGFIFETIADYQLLCFRQNPSNRGQLLKTGLWSYVRHPNYLGEIAQWWAIWILALPISLGWAFIISPLLITLLIVKVSGIAPVEEKMKKHSDFAEYAKNTPSIIPPSLINGALYAVTWFILVYSGARGSLIIPVVISVVNSAIQMFLFSKSDRDSFLVSIPLMLYALVLGFIQETLFIHFGLVEYPGQEGMSPPFWLFALYPLFSLTLNSSLLFLNQSLIVSFCLGGAGSALSYLWGQRLGGVLFLSPLAYYFLFLCWGLYLTILIILNRKLIALRNLYTEPRRLSQPLTVFFDTDCPACYREMQMLQKRKQTGLVIYASLQSDEQLKKLTSAFTYRQAMGKIHALDSKGGILMGINALSDLYARTDLPILAVILQAPFLKPVFKLCYAIWAEFRTSLRD